MIFSEYTTRTKTGKVDEYLAMLPKFMPLYQKYGIKFVGAWKTVDKQDEAVWMTGFESQQQREQQITKMKQDPEYQKLSQQAKSLIVDNTVRTLDPAPTSPLK